MKKISSFIICLLLFQPLMSQDIKVDIILDNCKSCHGEDYKGNSYIGSLKNLEKSDFISKMNTYIKEESNGIMARISRVLTKQDIDKMADKIYEKKK